MPSKLIACRAVMDQIAPFLPPEMEAEVLEVSLHVHPEQLRKRIQQAVDAADGIYDPIYLGYGMCSKALIGVKTCKSRLVAPKGDDCIDIFLGSRQARLMQLEKEPGTYFAAQGSVGESFSAVFPEYERSVARFGRVKADELLRTLMRQYRLLAYIRMPNAAALERDREVIREIAARFDLHPVEIEGTGEWLRGLIAREWDERYVVMEPGCAIERRHFAQES